VSSATAFILAAVSRKDNKSDFFKLFIMVLILISAQSYK